MWTAFSSEDKDGLEVGVSSIWSIVEGDPDGRRFAVAADRQSVTSEATIPRVGMFATVRNRRGLVSAVEPFDGDEGRLHLVHLEYKDDQLPHVEQLLWELEPRGRLLEPTALPEVSRADPMAGADFDALLRDARWTACRYRPRPCARSCSTR